MTWQEIADAQPLLIGAMFVLMLVLETARPLIEWSEGRWIHLRRNVGLTLVAFLAFALAGMAKLAVALWVTDHQRGGLFALPLSLPARIALSIVALDLVDYVLHRAQHAWPAIWRFHRVHHSDPHLDATSSLRFHPFDAVIQNAYQAAWLPVLGIGFDAMVAFDTLLLAVLYVQHANVHWPPAVDRALRLVFATPDVHRMHHAAEARYTNSNYGDLFSVWDRLFGTFTMADPATLRYGLDEFTGDRHQSVKGLLLMPLAPVHAESTPAPRATPGSAAVGAAGARPPAR